MISNNNKTNSSINVKCSQCLSLYVALNFANIYLFLSDRLVFNKIELLLKPIT